jgi:aminopeptidase N
MWKRVLLICTLAASCFTSFSQMSDNSQLSDNCIEKCSHAALSTSTNRVAYFQYPSMDKYDVKYLKLDIAVEANNRNIIGTALTRAQVLQPMDSFICELKNNMTVDSVFINGVKITGFTRGADHVFVPLSPSIPAGNTITALFYYRGLANSGGVIAGTVASNGLVYTASLSESYQGREWFPVKQILTDKIDSADIWITTDAANLAGSNGLLQAVVDRPANKKQFQWKSRYPIDYYLVSFAVGNYMDYKNYAKPAAIAPDSILIQHYIVNNNGFFTANKDNLDKTPAFIEKLSELYGLYPFRNEKYGHAQANIGGGMEHQTMSTMSSFGSTLIGHELAHQWFGDNVTCGSWNHIWVNEGFASYSEYLLIEKLPALFPGNTPATYMQNIHTNVMTVANGSVFVPDALVFDESRIFSNRLTYNKGLAIIHNLRFEIQDDAKFFQTLQTYQQQFKDKTATAEDFKNVAQTITGKNFTDFFNQWYYGEGYPTFNVDYSKQGDEIVLLVNQTVSAPAVTPFFKGLYEFTISTLQGDTTVKVNMTANDQVFRFRSNRTPNGVTIDPNNWVINKTGSITTGLNDPVNVSNEVKLFPNPVSTTIQLQYPANWFDKLSIFDVNGRLLNQLSVSRGSTGQTITPNLASGVYVVRMDGKGRVAVKKIVVSN